MSAVSNAEYLEMDGGEIAVLADSRNRARACIQRITGVPYVDLRVRKIWLRPCTCEGCQEDGPLSNHGYDEYWEYCARGDDAAVEWWIG